MQGSQRALGSPRAVLGVQVKVDAKTKEKLDEYKASKRSSAPNAQQGGQQQQPSGNGTTGEAPAADGAAAGGEAKPQPTDDIDEATWRQDRDTRESILHLLRSHASELNRGSDRERERDREPDRNSECCRAEASD